MDSDWDEEVSSDLHVGEAEWTKMSSEFMNVNRYREGIITGKQAALQEGFNTEFAQVGVPIGRELGLLRGIASVLAAFLSSMSDSDWEEARSISSALSSIRFSDMDVEAEEDFEDSVVPGPEKGDEKREIEDLENTLNRLSTAKTIKADEGRSTLEDIQQLKWRLKNLMERLSLDVE
ncbi:hypothetical protein ARMGADRAFT_918949 [Armillaria gallica]|uniref:Protein YAE1 n=1 Tax=Armillaria gallica TaxID=47427 RepID=A0A2H3EET6_ARMGA|nr:hypothetical protein ARMGADRAFT_918949 [Armillaria gallica]